MHLVFLSLICLLFAGPALADPCDELPPPSVKAKRIEEAEKLNTTYSYGSLTNIGHAIVRPGNLVLGLTRGNAIVKFAISIPSYVDRNGQWECASPQITLTYGFSPMTVYVAREFPPGTCAYNEIYQHEQRHVKAYQTHLASLEKEVLDLLSKRFATSGPWRGPVGQTSSRVQQELDERWTPYITRAIERVNEAQAQIDTPEEYTRVAESCNGEIKQRTGQKPKTKP